MAAASAVGAVETGADVGAAGTAATAPTVSAETPAITQVRMVMFMAYLVLESRADPEMIK